MALDDTGSITDAAGNILYSDPTNPQIFTIVSSNGQYNGIITYPSRKTSSLSSFYMAWPTSCFDSTHSHVMTGLQAVACDPSSAHGLQCESVCKSAAHDISEGTVSHAAPPPSTVSAMATAAARLLSKGAIAGIVIGVFFGVLIIVVIMAITFGILRRRRILQVG